MGHMECTQKARFLRAEEITENAAQLLYNAERNSVLYFVMSFHLHPKMDEIHAEDASTESLLYIKLYVGKENDTE